MNNLNEKREEEKTIKRVLEAIVNTKTKKTINVEEMNISQIASYYYKRQIAANWSQAMTLAWAVKKGECDMKNIINFDTVDSEFIEHVNYCKITIVRLDYNSYQDDYGNFYTLEKGRHYFLIDNNTKESYKLSRREESIIDDMRVIKVEEENLYKLYYHSNNIYDNHLFLRGGFIVENWNHKIYIDKNAVEEAYKIYTANGTAFKIGKETAKKLLNISKRANSISKEVLVKLEN